MSEVWKVIPGYPDYKISTIGVVKRGEKIITQGFNQKGYCVVHLYRKAYVVHRLIALTFLENPNNLPTVDHINRDRKDNRLENLRWASHADQAINRGLHETNKLKQKGISKHLASGCIT